MATPVGHPTSRAQPPGARASWLIAALATGLLIAVAGRYGPHRDELYFVVAGHHPAWGYPDQPPLTPLIAALMDQLTPGNLVVLRLPSAVAAGGMVVVASLTARELGGASAAQVLTSVVVGSDVVTLVIGHLLSTSTVDVLCWAVVVLLVLRALGRDEPRWWLAAGLMAGLGLENKQLLAFLLVGLAVGVALTAETRHHLTSRWLWGGVAFVVVLALPDVVWQAANGWPQLAVSADINDEYGGTGERIFYVVQQLILFSPLAGVLWVFGLVQLFRRPQLGWARPVAIAYVVIFVLLAVTAGKGYYVAGILPALAAAGCVVLAERWSRRRLVAAGATLAVAAFVAWPAALPLLPATTFGDSVYASIGEDQLETIGWPAFVATISAVVESLPPGQQASVVVYASNYGEAGALDYYGAPAPVFSGHNGWRAWGPPDEGAAPVVVVGLDDPSQDFRGCIPAATIDNGLGVDNEEQGKTVWLCAAPRAGWSHAWLDLVHLDG